MHTKFLFLFCILFNLPKVPQHSAHKVRLTWLRNAGLSDLDLRLLDMSLYIFVRDSAVFRRPLTAEVRVRS